MAVDVRGEELSEDVKKFINRLYRCSQQQLPQVDCGNPLLKIPKNELKVFGLRDDSTDSELNSMALTITNKKVRDMCNIALKHKPSGLSPDDCFKFSNRKFHRFSTCYLEKREEHKKCVSLEAFRVSQS